MQLEIQLEDRNVTIELDSESREWLVEHGYDENFIYAQDYKLITDLINKSKKNNKKVGVYPINHEDWIDTGQWNEYQKAIQKLT